MIEAFPLRRKSRKRYINDGNNIQEPLENDLRRIVHVIEWKEVSNESFLYRITLYSKAQEVKTVGPKSCFLYHMSKGQMELCTKYEIH